MRNLSLAMVGALFLCAPAGAATFGFDAGHTEIRFYWDHVGVSEQSAEWDVVEGKVDFDPNDLADHTLSLDTLYRLENAAVPMTVVIRRQHDPVPLGRRDHPKLGFSLRFVYFYFFILGFHCVQPV